MSSDQTRVADAPEDGISRVTFAPSSNLFAASSWDKTMRLYDATTSTMRTKFDHLAPLLTCAFSDDTTAFCGGLEQAVHMHDTERGSHRVLGTHEGPIRCMSYSHDINSLLTAGWDAALHLWDPRSPTSLQSSITLPDRAYAMTLVGGQATRSGAADPRIVIGCRGRSLRVYDLRRMDTPEIERESPLKHQIRSLAGFETGDGFAVGSIDGRVAMEMIGTSDEEKAKRFAFKCHRIKRDGTEVAYPINDIAFHPGYGTFATAGADGTINFWDGVAKKRLGRTDPYETSVASIAFNHDGSLLAVASSYTFEEGDKAHPADALYVRPIADADVRPKAKKQG